MGNRLVFEPELRIADFTLRTPTMESGGLTLSGSLALTARLNRLSLNGGSIWTSHQLSSSVGYRPMQ
jgi:hypothetical protein